MGKRTKLILGIAIAAVVIGTGSVFALGKTGVINFKTFADTVVTKTQQLAGTKSAGTIIFIVKPTINDANQSELLAGTKVTAYKVGSNPAAGISGTTAQQSGIDGFGNRITQNIVNLTLIANTEYNFVITCPDGGYSTNPARINSNSYSGSNFFNPYTFAPTCAATGDQTKYCIRGKIVNATTNALLQGARATVGSASGTSDSFGNYSISNLTFANLASAKIIFSMNGFVTTLPQNITSLNSSIRAGTCDNTMAIAALIPSVPPPADTFSELGTVKDKNGNLLSEVIIKVSCLNSDQTAGVSCGSGTTSWQSSSYSTLQTYYTGLPANKTFNAEVPSIKRYSSYTNFPALRLTFAKAGYYWDSNGDGIDNDSSDVTFIPKPTTTYTVNGNQAYLSFFGNEIMIQKAVAMTYSIKGTVKDATSNTNLSGVSINGGNPTNSSGNYEINNLQIASAATQTFIFHKDGYTDQTKTLQQLGLSPSDIIASQTTPYNMRLVQLTPIPANSKVSLIGTVKNSSNNFTDATIKVSCIPGTSCSGGPWTATSSTSQLSTYPKISIPYNFVVPNISPPTDGSQMTIEIIKTGYFYDENKNQIDDESSTKYISPTFSMVWTNVGPGETFANITTLGSASLVQRSTFEVLGAVTLGANADTMVPELKVSVVGLEFRGGEWHPNDSSRRDIITTANHLINQHNVSVNYKFPSNIPDYYAKYRIIITDPNNNFRVENGTKDFDKSKIVTSGTPPSRHYIYNTSASNLGDHYFVATATDRNTNQRIPGAVAVIYDPVCGVIEQTAASNDGIALIGGNFFTYHEAITNRNYSGTRYKNCLAPELIVTKPGYFKYIGVLDRYSTNEAVKLLPETSAPINSVSGVVIEGSQPLAGATISMWRGTNPNPAAALPSLTSDASGKFATGTLSRGWYIITATKTGYLRNSKSIIYFEIFGNEKIFINLELKLLPPEQLYSKVIVLEKDLLTSIAGVSLEVKDLKQNTVVQNSTTDDDGVSTLFLTINTNFQIKAKKGTIEQIKNITVPSNFNSYSEQQKQDFNKQLIFVLDTNIAHANTYPEITFKVVDQDKNPIQGAKISFDYMTFDGADSEMGIQTNINTTTNANGKARFKSDFMASIKAPNLAELIAQKNLFSLNDTIENLNVSKSGYFYWPKMASNRAYKLNEISADISKCPYNGTCTIIIEMWQQKTGYGGLSVVVAEFLNSHNDAYLQSMLNQIGLEKQNANGSWSPYSPKSHEDGIREDNGFRFFDDIPNGKYRAKIASINTTSEVATVNNSYESVELLFCSAQGSQYAYNYNDKIKLIFFSNSQYQRFLRNRQLYDHIGKIVADSMSFSNNTHPVVVSLNSDADINASAYTIRLDCLGFQDAGLINIQEGLMQFYETTGTSWELDGTVVHEFAHTILEDYRQSNNAFYKRWLELYNMINNTTNKTLKNCVWNSIKESTLSNIIMDFGGHPWDDESEMFASFTTDFFLYHDKMRENIQLNCPPGQCQNVLQYMWTLYSEGAGSIQISDTEIFGPMSGGVTGSRYTFDQIANGKWKQSVYDSLGLIEKSKVQFSRFVSPSINSTRATVSTMIARFNSFIATLLGAFPNRGTVSGKVTNRNGASVANVVVQIGPLAGITDTNGNYSISGIPEGEQPIIRAQHAVNGHIYRVITPASGKLNVTRNATTTGNIVIN